MMNTITVYLTTSQSVVPKLSPRIFKKISYLAKKGEAKKIGSAKLIVKNFNLLKVETKVKERGIEKNLWNILNELKECQSEFNTIGVEVITILILVNQMDYQDVALTEEMFSLFGKIRIVIKFAFGNASIQQNQKVITDNAVFLKDKRKYLKGVLITDKNEVEIFPDSKKTIGIKKNTKSNVISRPNRTIIDNSEIKKGTDDFTQKVNPATKRAYNPAAASGTRPGSIQGRKSVISTKSGNDKPKK